MVPLFVILSEAKNLLHHEFDPNSFGIAGGNVASRSFAFAQDDKKTSR